MEEGIENTQDHDRSRPVEPAHALHDVGQRQEGTENGLDRSEPVSTDHQSQSAKEPEDRSGPSSTGHVRSVPLSSPAKIRKEHHTVPMGEAFRRLQEASVTDNKSSVRRWVREGKLDGGYDDEEGRYYISPPSLEKLIESKRGARQNADPEAVQKNALLTTEVEDLKGQLDRKDRELEEKDKEKWLLQKDIEYKLREIEMLQASFHNAEESRKEAERDKSEILKMIVARVSSRDLPGRDGPTLPAGDEMGTTRTDQRPPQENGHDLPNS